MLLKSARLQNFRSVRDATILCEPLTALVGPNGSGKSAFLRALDIFYTANPAIDIEDFYNCEDERPIEITLTFTSLEPEAKAQFSSYLRGEDLAVTRSISRVDGKLSARYHGSRLQSPDFAVVRAQERALEKKAAYEKLRGENPKYASLQKAITATAVDAAMIAWEKTNPDKCDWERDEGNFFGFTAVAQGYLGRFTNFIYIPAVRDAALDAREGKGAPITTLVDWLVRKTLADQENVRAFRQSTQQKYAEILKPALGKLQELGLLLSRTLQTYVPDASIDLNWFDAELLEFPVPRADVKLVEDEFSCAVGRTGHGLQRAFILTVLQHLAVTPAAPAPARVVSNQPAAADTSFDTKQPNVLLAIEEPEIYQHPNRQRYFAKVLLDLTTGAREGVAQSTQVIYTTHSPLFVGLDRFNEIRRLRKVRSAQGKPKITQVASTTFDDIAERLWIANDRRDTDGQECPVFTGEQLRPRLHTLMTPWVNEGFFADVVVLVEGEDDRAAVLGTAAALGHDFESMGISVIPCDGKSRMDRPIAIFQALQISCYAIWDSDVDKKGTDKEKESSGQNKRLLRLMVAKVEDFPNRIEQHFGCFEIKLEKTIEAEIGSTEYAKLLQNAQNEFGYTDKKSATKSPFVVAKTISDARPINLKTKTLEQLVENILRLKRSPREKQLSSDSPEHPTPILDGPPKNAIGQGSLPLDSST